MSDYKPLPKGWKCDLDNRPGGYLGILRGRDGLKTITVTGPYNTKEDAWCHIRLLVEEDNIRWDDAFVIRTHGDGLVNCSDYGPNEMRWVRMKNWKPVKP